MYLIDTVLIMGVTSFFDCSNFHHFYGILRRNPDRFAHFPVRP